MKLSNKQYSKIRALLEEVPVLPLSGGGEDNAIMHLVRAIDIIAEELYYGEDEE